MKKIIKSSVLFVGACLFAGAVNAQLSSDKPAMTAQQMNDLLQKGRTNAAKSAVTTSGTNAVSSDKPAMTTQQQERLQKRGNTNTEAKVEPAKTETTLPVSTQGDAKPVLSSPATESKAVPVPTQSDKPVSVKQS